MSTHEGLTGIEQSFDQDEIIVSKTDLKGRILYVNRVFERVSGYSESELLGKAHNIIRHPAMPRCVFKYLWDTIASGHEVFAYVVNRCKNGDHYWVLAHVTPTFDDQHHVVGYHSNRRVPSREAVKQIDPLYRKLLDVESRHKNPREQWRASLPVLIETLDSLHLSYDEFIFTLCTEHS